MTYERNGLDPGLRPFPDGGGFGLFLADLLRLHIQPVLPAPVQFQLAASPADREDRRRTLRRHRRIPVERSGEAIELRIEIRQDSDRIPDFSVDRAKDTDRMHEASERMPHRLGLVGLAKRRLVASAERAICIA